MRQALRVNVVGSSASGKSTFARELARRAGAPYIEMDALSWEGRWQAVPEERFLARLREAVAQESWVLDGNYNRTREIKWERATHVVWIDRSFGRTLWQSLRRSVARTLSGGPIWEGTECREDFRRSFLSKDSVIWWMITNYRHNRRRYLKLKNEQKPFEFVHVRTPAEARAAIDRLTRR